MEEREDNGGQTLLLQVEAAVQQQHRLQQGRQGQPAIWASTITYCNIQSSGGSLETC